MIVYIYSTGIISEIKGFKKTDLCFEDFISNLSKLLKRRHLNLNNITLSGLISLYLSPSSLLGNFCPMCDKCYNDDDHDSKMMECARCNRGVHAKCENLTGQ